MWPTFRAAGARYLVVTGRVNDRDTVNAYAVAGTARTLCRLHAGPDELTARILRRGRGDGTVLPGDELYGLPVDTLHELARQAADEAVRLDREGIGDLRVDTDGRSVDEVVRMITAQTPDLTDRSGRPCSPGPRA